MEITDLKQMTKEEVFNFIRQRLSLFGNKSDLVIFLLFIFRLITLKESEFMELFRVITLKTFRK